VCVCVCVCVYVCVFVHTRKNTHGVMRSSPRLLILSF
jgi:hypothetical protein